jgi:hypothetical protein
VVKTLDQPQQRFGFLPAGFHPFLVLPFVPAPTPPGVQHQENVKNDVQINYRMHLHGGKLANFSIAGK